MTDEPEQEASDAVEPLAPDAAPTGRHAASSSPAPGDRSAAGPTSPDVEPRVDDPSSDGAGAGDHDADGAGAGDHEADGAGAGADDHDVDAAAPGDRPEVVIGPGLLDDVPPELLEDPRGIARASLIAGRNASLWWVCAGVAVVVLLAVFVSAWAGATSMALLLAVGAIVRVVVPSPGPVALTVRSRTVDVTVLLLLAVGVGVLAQLIPEG